VIRSSDGGRMARVSDTRSRRGRVAALHRAPSERQPMQRMRRSCRRRWPNNVVVDGIERWGHRDLNPARRVSSGSRCSCVSERRAGDTGRRSSWSSTVSKPTRRHSRATGARSTTKLYYTPECWSPKISSWPGGALACDVAVSSCATSSAGCRSSSRRGNLASW
jgi:hypothetical protein